MQYFFTNLIFFWPWFFIISLCFSFFLIIASLVLSHYAGIFIWNVIILDGTCVYLCLQFLTFIYTCFCFLLIYHFSLHHFTLLVVISCGQPRAFFTTYTVYIRIFFCFISILSSSVLRSVLLFGCFTPQRSFVSFKLCKILVQDGLFITVDSFLRWHICLKMCLKDWETLFDNLAPVVYLISMGTLCTFWRAKAGWW